MGQVLLRRGDAAGAFERLGQLSGDIAESGLTFALRALAGAQADKASEAVKLAQRAESAAPNDPNVKALLARALWTMGERDQARTLARAALALDPQRTSLRRWLGDSP
ncbi:tetratricopeptide repeat protein [Myxococcota bacterium]|nr:tetratricopeptide repeat protein [Myxococcota bacterium]